MRLGCVRIFFRAGHAARHDLSRLGEYQSPAVDNGGPTSNNGAIFLVWVVLLKGSIGVIFCSKFIISSACRAQAVGCAVMAAARE